MSKERLEEIKKNIESHKSWARGTHYAKVTYEELEEIDWLIEQAERVRELERENRALKAVASSNKFIGEQYLQKNNRCRESIKLALNHIHTGNFNLATVELNKALLKEVEQ